MHQELSRLMEKCRRNFPNPLFNEAMPYGHLHVWHYSEDSAVSPPYMQQLPGWFTCTLNLICTSAWEKGQEKSSQSVSIVQQKTVLPIQPVYIILFPLQSTTWFVCLASSLHSQAAGVFLVVGFFFPVEFYFFPSSRIISEVALSYKTPATNALIL